MDRGRHERESCDTLRIINEDLHDVQSGRQFPEFTLKRTHPEDMGFNWGRTAVGGQSFEFYGLGSYIIYTVDGDDYFRSVTAACYQRSIVSLHDSRRSPRKFAVRSKE